jgi:hypothetical protein
MSNTTNNSLTKSHKGKFGKDFVFRTRDNVSIMAHPAKKSNKVPGESQIAVRRRFKMASRWAKQALADPDTLAFYQSVSDGMKTPYVMAVADYMRPPQVGSIDTSRYSGNIGDRIIVDATDNIKVKSVTVAIKGKDGIMIETGPCVEDLEADKWHYTATVNVPDLAGVIISAVALDTPNHPGELEVTL